MTTTPQSNIRAAREVVETGADRVPLRVIGGTAKGRRLKLVPGTLRAR